MTWKEFKSFMKAPWKIKKQWSLYHKTVFHACIPAFDDFASKDCTYHEYLLTLDIEKHYTLQGVRYKLSTPDYTTWGEKSIYPPSLAALSPQLPVLNKSHLFCFFTHYTPSLCFIHLPSMNILLLFSFGNVPLFFQ